MDRATVDELLSTTRSVRKRLDLNRPVGRDVILECIQLAMQAPTASNTQDWRWLVITDADKRAAIADIYRSIGAEYLALAAKDTSEPQTRRVYASAFSLTDTGPRSRACHPLPGEPHRQLECADCCVGLGVDHPGGLELPASPSLPRSRISVDDNAFGQGARGRGPPGYPGYGHPGRAVPGGLHDWHGFPASRPAARGEHHLLGHLGTA